MVGRSLFSSAKSTSLDQRRDQNDTSHTPPPYNENANPQDAVVAKTLTTTVTTTTQTTQTTTHFFSLPIWRRRAPPTTASSSGRPSTSQSDVNDDGTIKKPNSLMVDKELPVTPTSEDDEEFANANDPRRVGRAFSNSLNASESSLRPSLSFPNILTTRSSGSSSNLPGTLQHSQTTRALAHAALGLGLPHVMPRASTSSSTTDTSSSIPFMGSVSATPEYRQSGPDIRRAKSFTRGTNERVAPNPSKADDGSRRRTRGLSLVPITSDSRAISEEVKAKQVIGDAQVMPPGPKPLMRRSSFWSRRKMHSPSETPQMSFPSEQRSHTPSLPSFQPVSPFIFDIQQTSTLASQPSNARSTGLYRRHSERSSSHSSRTSPLDHTFHIPSTPSIPGRTPSHNAHSRRPSSIGSFSYNGDRPKSLQMNYLSSVSAPLSPATLPESLPGPHEHEQPPSYQPRPRSQTNPPRLLHRLSMGFFGSSTPPMLVSSPTATTSVLTSNILSSSPAQSGPPSPMIPPAKLVANVPKPRTDEESPELFLRRLEEAVSKAEIANVLASSGDSFYAHALQAYIDRFDFTNDPLDVALRKLLMDVGLPKETQQIDRVMEAFAARYAKSNTGLFVSDDNPYILAFSLIMLHTDAFNKSNKRKMTKADYIKNTRLPGVPPEVLDCFFDNIVFAPFIFIEDPLDVNGQRGLVQDANASRVLPIMNGQRAGTANGSGTTIIGKGGKIDPYYLITKNLLDTLRVDVERHIPLRNPYSYQGTAGSWDEEELHRAFARPDIIEVSATDSRRSSTLPLFSISVGGAPSPVTNAFAGLPELSPDLHGSHGKPATLKVTKVGLLNRKEDLMEGGKKATNRKWKEWSVILTGSQLLFFRDPAWSLGLIAQSESAGGQVLSPHMSQLKPDELLSVKDAIAVHDRSYTKYDYTLRFVMPTGRHFLLQAESEQERNEWIAHINYASAFKTAGIKMRAMSMSEKELRLTGMAAAASHLQERRHKLTGRPLVHSWVTDISDEASDDMYGSSSPPTPDTPSTRHYRRILSGTPDQTDLEVDTSSLPTFQLKTTFDQVKADLAASSDSTDEHGDMSAQGRPRSYTYDSPTAGPYRTSNDLGTKEPHSRFQIIGSKIRDLESKISVTQAQLDADIRFVRNLAVLTPFQRSTRDRIQGTVINLSKRVMQVRLDLMKLVCHRHVLNADLAAEERDWQRSHQQAYEAATETLQKDLGVRIPKMTLSMHGEGLDLAHPVRQSNTSNGGMDIVSGSPRPESSICESFHSALEFGPDWPGPHPPSSFSYPYHKDLDTSIASRTGSTSSIHSFPFTNENPQATSVARDSSSLRSHSIDEHIQSPSLTGRDVHHEKFYTAQEATDEQAEEWNKTRAAKRVSLVTLPADLRVSALLERHGRNADEKSVEGTSPRRVIVPQKSTLSELPERFMASPTELKHRS